MPHMVNSCKNTCNFIKLMSDSLCDDVTGPMNTSQLNCIVQRHIAVTVEHSDSSSSQNISLYELTESQSGDDILVHTADTSYSNVDVFHAYCALAVVKHRLSVDQCTLNCCVGELTACEIAGLCRQLLWDVDMYRRRYLEELLYIQQLQTSLSTNSDMATDQLSYRSGSGTDPIVIDDLPSQDEPTLTVLSGRSAADSAHVNIINAVEGPGSLSHWQMLPVDIKYSQHKLSVELLEQEADRLRHLCDGLNHCVVNACNYYYILKLNSLNGKQLSYAFHILITCHILRCLDNWLLY